MRRNVATASQPVSTLLLDEWFQAGDARFLPALNACADDCYLAGLASRWIKDSRPWAQEQARRYAVQPLDRPGHHPLVKRLFKSAEARADDAMMAGFLHACDVAVRRRLHRQQVWDAATRTRREDVELELPRLALLPQHAAKHAQAKPARRQRRQPAATPMFSLATRLYLRRRAWRYVRRCGFQDPARYVPLASAALGRYSDAELAAGQDLLESWGLLHACFGRSPVLTIGGTWVGLAAGRNLSELTAAPMFPALWQAPDALSYLLDLAIDAESRLVRTWARDLLRAHHGDALVRLPLPRVQELLSSRWEDLRLWGMELLRAHPELSRLPVRSWLDLLSRADTGLLAALVDLLRAQVRGSRLGWPDLVEMMVHPAAAVVRLGLDYAEQVPCTDVAAWSALEGLGQARCAALAGDLARFGLQRLGQGEACTPARVAVFTDHLLPGVRMTALEWIAGQESLRGDPRIWAQLAETPWDDVRAWLVRSLDRLHEAARLEGDARRLLWSAVILGVHRGGRAKLAALRQLGEHLVAMPAEAGQLLPVLACALRSVRLPERRGALAAVAHLLVRRPELAASIAISFPELRVGPTPQVA